MVRSMGEELDQPQRSQSLTDPRNAAGMRHRIEEKTKSSDLLQLSGDSTFNRSKEQGFSYFGRTKKKQKYEIPPHINRDIPQEYMISAAPIARLESLDELDKNCLSQR